jgi:anti-anti-sigma regulatory factor
MLRITRDEAGRRLRLEGRLTREDLATLREAVGGERRLELDLAGLRFLDAPGAEALGKLRAAGARLRGGSSFVRQLLEEVAS